MLDKTKLRKCLGQKVYVFKEIKNQVWTIWNEERTHLICWATELQLTNASFFVDQIKREHVVRTNKRLPHAGVFGILTKIEGLSRTEEVYYNPFTTKKFQKRKSDWL